MHGKYHSVAYIICGEYLMMIVFSKVITMSKKEQLTSFTRTGKFQNKTNLRKSMYFVDENCGIR